MIIRWLLAALTVVFYALHQDFWFWRTAGPIVFGVFPVGLFYHVGYALSSSLLLWLLVRHAWPSHLEDAHAPSREPVDPR